MKIEEIIVRDPKLAFYIGNVKPFCEQYLQAHNNYPTWEILNKQFENRFGKAGAKIWFNNLVGRYNRKFLDLAKKKINNNYNEDIGIPLKARFDSINLASGSYKRGRKSLSFSDVEAKEIAKLL